MTKTLISSVVAVVAFTLLLGLAYPLVMTGIAQVAFPGSANGSQIKRDGKVVGSKLLAQDFGRDPPGTTGDSTGPPAAGRPGPARASDGGTDHSCRPRVDRRRSRLTAARSGLPFAPCGRVGLTVRRARRDGAAFASSDCSPF